MLKNTAQLSFQVRVHPGSSRESFTNILSSLGIGELRPYKVNYSDCDVPQTGSFSVQYSDHRAGFYSLRNQGLKPLSAVSHNMMAQARKSSDKKPANTAFGHEESDAMYIKRWVRLLRLIKKSLESDPSIAFLAFQEAPVKEQLPIFRDCINAIFPEEWRLLEPGVFSDGTQWGVFTIINMERMKVNGVTLDDTLTKDIAIKDIDIRCRTFLMHTREGELVKFTNLHLPHNDPATAFIAFMTNVIREVLINGRDQSFFKHSLIGDWNLEPTVIKALIEQILIDEVKKIKSNNQSPFCLDINVASSKDGHLKQNGAILSVDGMVTLAVTPSDVFSYTVGTNPTNLAYTGVLCASLFIGGAAFKNASENDECEEKVSCGL